MGGWEGGWVGGSCTYGCVGGSVEDDLALGEEDDVVNHGEDGAVFWVGG